MNHISLPVVITNLDALAASLFIICAFGIVGARQVGTCLKFFVFESLFLACSAIILGISPLSYHLIGVGVVNLITKVFLLPYLLIRIIPRAIYTKREITHVLNIPSSLLIALGLSLVAYFFSLPIVRILPPHSMASINLPVGVAGLLLGAYTLAVRREAVPQLLGILAMENGAFFAGISLASHLSLITELAAAFDILVMAFVVGILTKKIHEQTGSTSVGMLRFLKEEGK